MSDIIEIEVSGQRFRIRSHGGPDYLQELAQHVTEVMSKVQNSTHSPNSDRIAIMAALHIADELYQVKRRQEQERSERKQLIQRLLTVSDRFSE